MIKFIGKCPYCLYVTNVKCNLKRHINARHKNINNGKRNVIPDGENVTPGGENVTPDGENVTPSIFCQKCNKKYKTIKYLSKHELQCNGIDELTCPRCMITFSNRSHKSRHLKMKKCEARSIIHARTPNIQNIVNNNYNNYNTTIEVQNNFTINNYLQERIDYLTFERMLETWKKGFGGPSSLTNEIHFNKNFPENRNIFSNDKTSALVMENGNYVKKDIKMLAEELFNSKSTIIQDFAYKHKDKICENINMQVYEEIADLLMKLLIKEPKHQYAKQVNKIIDMIKNS